MRAALKIFLIIIVVVAVLGGAGYYAFQSLSAPPEEEIDAAAQQAARHLDQAEQSDAPKSGAATAEVGLSETEFQIHLHQMTHQKIVASKKRGAIEMTPETIDNMLKIARANEEVYEESEFYEKTLTAWEQGDFTNSINVHNTIWEWHDGTVGRATGLMTPEQEARYVEEFFN